MKKDIQKNQKLDFKTLAGFQGVQIVSGPLPRLMKSSPGEKSNSYNIPGLAINGVSLSKGEHEYYVQYNFTDSALAEALPLLLLETIEEISLVDVLEMTEGLYETSQILFINKKDPQDEVIQKCAQSFMKLQGWNVTDQLNSLMRLISLFPIHFRNWIHEKKLHGQDLIPLLAFEAFSERNPQTSLLEIINYLSEVLDEDTLSLLNKNYGTRILELLCELILIHLETRTSHTLNASNINASKMNTFKMINPQTRLPEMTPADLETTQIIHSEFDSSKFKSETALVSNLTDELKPDKLYQKRAQFGESWLAHLKSLRYPETDKRFEVEKELWLSLPWPKQFPHRFVRKNDKTGIELNLFISHQDDLRKIQVSLQQVQNLIKERMEKQNDSTCI